MATNPYINVPVYAWYTPYINGIGLTYLTGTTLAVTAGSCTDSSVQNVITLPTAVTVNAATVGAGGIDAGALAANTFYAVYAIGSSQYWDLDENNESDATNPYPGTAIISTSYTGPSMPANYDMYRYIGSVLTDGSSNILKFVQTGDGTDRTMWYDVAISVLSGGSSATYVNVNLVTAVPTAGLEVLALTTFTPTAASNAINLLPYGSSATVGYAVLTGSVAAVATTQVLRLPSGSNLTVPYIQYKVTGSAASIGVSGYIDEL